MELTGASPAQCPDEPCWHLGVAPSGVSGHRGPPQGPDPGTSASPSAPLGHIIFPPPPVHGFSFLVSPAPAAQPGCSFPSTNGHEVIPAPLPVPLLQEGRGKTLPEGRRWKETAGIADLNERDGV